MSFFSGAALAAPDFGAAVDLLARYKRLTCPEEIRGTQPASSRWMRPTPRNRTPMQT